MRALIALVGATVVACAAAPPPRTIGNRAPIPAIDLAWRELRVRPPHPPVPLGPTAAAASRALAAVTPQGACEAALYHAWIGGAEALLLHVATLAPGPSRCRVLAVQLAAALAPVVEQEERSGCTAFVSPRAQALWRQAARLAADPAQRQVALRNAAEVAWRSAAGSYTSASWRDVAMAFARAAAAGDREAAVIEVVAWHNALASDRWAVTHGFHAPIDEQAALVRRVRRLAGTAPGRALDRELAAWRADVIASPPPPR